MTFLRVAAGVSRGGSVSRFCSKDTGARYRCEDTGVKMLAKIQARRHWCEDSPPKNPASYGPPASAIGQIQITGQKPVTYRVFVPGRSARSSHTFDPILPSSATAIAGNAGWPRQRKRNATKPKQSRIWKTNIAKGSDRTSATLAPAKRVQRLLCGSSVYALDVLYTRKNFSNTGIAKCGLHGARLGT